MLKMKVNCRFSQISGKIHSLVFTEFFPCMLQKLPVTNIRSKIHTKRGYSVGYKIKRKEKEIKINRRATEITGEGDEIFARYHHWDESASVLFCPRVRLLQDQIPGMRDRTQLRFHAHSLVSESLGSLIKNTFKGKSRHCYQEKGKRILDR